MVLGLNQMIMICIKEMKIKILKAIVFSMKVVSRLQVKEHQNAKLNMLIKEK